MAVIEANFAPKQATFDYPAFRAEFVWRRQMTSFQRANEDGERARARTADCAEVIPYWAEFQRAPGIANVIHTWQAERYIDPDNGAVRYTQGLLEQVRHPVVEPYALAAIEARAATLLVTEGRTYLTPTEFRILNLSKRYLAESEQLELRHKYYGFEPHYRADGSLIEKSMHGWISRSTGFAISYIERLLITVENVYLMRAALSLEGEPEVRIAPERQREQSAEIAA